MLAFLLFLCTKKCAKKRSDDLEHRVGEVPGIVE